MKILLVCAAGMSTTMMVNNMKKVADPSDVIEAHPVAELESIIDNFDVVLVGPQIRHKWNDVKKIADAHNTPAELIEMSVYGSMNGKAAMDIVHRLLG